MTGTLGYDRGRMSTLKNHTLWSIGAIHGLSCSDSEAGEAIAALGAMRTVLDGGWMGVITEIERRDPLYRLGGNLGGVDAAFETHQPNRFDDLYPTTDYTYLDNLDLLGELIDMQDTQPTNPADPNHDEQFWTDDFPEYAREIANRVLIDPEFAQQLLDSLDQFPILGLIVAETWLPPSFVEKMARVLVVHPPNRLDPRINAHDAAVQAVLTALSEHPDSALRLMGEHDFVATLVTYDKLAPGVVTGFMEAGLITAVEQDPRLLADGHAALAAFVAAANEYPIDLTGFPPVVAQTLSGVLARYATSMLDGLSGTGTDFNVEVDGHFTRLATLEEYRDFLGALLHDPGSRVILIAISQAATAYALGGGSDFELRDVAAFGQLLDAAAQNENLEHEMSAAASIALIGTFFTLVGFGATAATSDSGLPVKTIVSLALSALKSWATSSVDPDSIGAEDVFAQIQILIGVEIHRAFLADPGAHADGRVDPQLVAVARSRLAALDAALESDPGDREVNDINRLRLDLDDAVRAAGGDTFVDASLAALNPQPGGTRTTVTSADIGS